jgi:hypothetical protein
VDLAENDALSWYSRRVSTFGKKLEVADVDMGCPDMVGSVSRDLALVEVLESLEKQVDRQKSQFIDIVS